MRLSRAWVVARKDFSEFRANRQILLTLTLLPLLFAVVFPLLFSVPLFLLPDAGEEGPPEVPLGNLAAIPPGTYSGEVFENASLRDSTVGNSVINASRVENVTLTNVYVVDSLLVNVTIESGFVLRSVILNSTVAEEVALHDTWVSAEDPLEATFRATYAEIALNLPVMFFVVLSAAVPTTLAAYSFVGEKAGRSLEPLLATPLTDGELLLGKYLSAFVPTMAVMLGAWGIYTGIADAVLVPRLGVLPLPNLTWILGIFVVMPLFSFLGISANVLISTRVSDVRTAQQYGGLIVLPVVFLFVLPAGGAVVFGPSVMLLTAGILALADAAVFLLTLKLFRREEILTKWK